jgi:hypothetical protein
MSPKLAIISGKGEEKRLFLPHPYIQKQLQLKIGLRSQTIRQAAL